MNQTLSILFTGYAPVHFLCFEPLYQRLRELDDFEVFLSGGIRTTQDDGVVTHDCMSLYSRFDVDPQHVLSVEEISTRSFDILFSAHTNLITPMNVEIGSVQIFHGISFRNRGLRPDNMHCDYYFVTGPYMHRRLVEQGLIEKNDPRMIPIGFMKTDRLVNGALDRRDLLRQYDLDDSRPLVVYAPTGAKHNSMKTMGEDVVKNLKDSGKFNLIIKLHDHPKEDIDWNEKLRPLEDQHTIVARNDDVIPLLHAADILISDASSVSSEFSLCDRPMVFLDVPKLLAKMEAAEYKTMDTETWGRKAGLIVEKPEQISSAVEEALDDKAGLSALRQQMAKDLFYNPGESVDAALTWLHEIKESSLRFERLSNQ